MEKKLPYIERIKMGKVLQIIKESFYKVSAGRPMDLIGHAFFDRITRKDVYYFKDKYAGSIWMAHHRWAKFRVISHLSEPEEPNN